MGPRDRSGRLWQAGEVGLYELRSREPLAAPALVAALDGWVDAGGCGTGAAEYLARGAEVVATFDLDRLLDYRARRPLLDIVGGRLTGMEWPELTVRKVTRGGRDLLVLTGPEPDYGWQRFRGALIELALELGVVQSVCVGAIPAMVPHTRPAPIIMTGTDRAPREGDPPLPAEHLRVPAAAVNLVELSLADQGIPSVGFWAQVPHYVGGVYAAGALELVGRVADHLGVDVPVDDLAEQAREERARLDEIVAARPEARAYLERLEDAQQMAPPGGDIAGEVERFLREVTGESRNPFEEP
jgi:hypothetical protein